MERPVRRSRQRVSATGVIGLLPQEEAAINRALHESLLEEKKKTGGGRLKQETVTTPSPPPPSYVTAGPSDAFNKRELGLFSDSPSKPSTSTTRLTRRGRLRSPISPSHSLDSLSCDSKSSSPVRGTGTRSCYRQSSSSLSSPPSVESSLKLILSPGSWSRSSSPCWTPTPEDTNLNKTPPKSSKSKKPIPSKLKSPVVVSDKKPIKRKRGRPRKYPPKKTSAKTTLKFGKGGKNQSSSTAGTSHTLPKTYTKASLQFHRAKITKIVRGKYQWTGSRGGRGGGRGGRGGGGGGGKGSRGILRPLSPEAAIVLHDHCYMDHGFVEESKSSPSTSTNSPSIRSSPYSAQRKFAHNQAPNVTPTRPAKQEVESVSRTNDIPKTEDFITFLCLRGSDSIPRHLEKFAFPWTLLQRRKSKTGQDFYLRHFPNIKGNNGKQNSKNVARKLGVSMAASCSPNSAIH